MKGYTAKVGLRKALRLRKIDWLNQAIRETTDPVMRSVWQCELYLLTGPYWHRGGFKGVAYDNGGLLEPITRTFNAYAAEPVLPPCPHCPCTYTTECCYCDGSRTPLEDS